MYAINGASLASGSLPLPDEYNLSPMEYYSSEPEYDPYSMQDYGLTMTETKGWLRRNWKWFAIGGGVLVGGLIVLKLVRR